MSCRAFVLLVEDNKDVRELLTEVLLGHGYHVKAADRIGDAEIAMQTTHFDAAIFDIKLPDGDGLELVRKARAITPEMGIILITGFAEVDLAIDALRVGADDFMKKPFSPDELIVRLEEVLNRHQVYRQYDRLLNEKAAESLSQNMIGACAAIEKIRNTIRMLSESDSTVLITGETGTGKEVVAKLLHQTGSRARNPFVSINCGAIPEELLESELFGHVKGAFTGAVKSRTGRFELAHKGTIFLDEIGDMSPNLQVKLLRVLQERAFEPVGSNETIEVDVRVVAATHRNLEKMVEEGKFREDLFYRLNVIPIHLPPLRERGEDVLTLAEHFLEHFRQTRGSQIGSLSKSAAKRFLEYSWPGNIRELQNVIERICTFKAEGDIETEDLPDKMLNEIEMLQRDFRIGEAGDFPIDLKAMVDEYELQLIMSALNHAQGNKSKAAELLTIKRTTLIEKLKKRGISASS